MALCDMEHDRPGLEQAEIAFLVGRDLPERMKRQMCGFLHRFERHKSNLVRLAHFLQRPANARIARQSLAAIGRPFKGGDHDGHREASPWPKSSAAGLEAVTANLRKLKTTRSMSGLSTGSEELPLAAMC